MEEDFLEEFSSGYEVIPQDSYVIEDFETISEEEMNGINNYAEELIQKIQERLEVAVPMTIYRDYSRVIILHGQHNYPTKDNLLVVKRKCSLHGFVGGRTEKQLTEEEAIKHSLNSIEGTKYYTNKLLVKGMKELNANFSKLFEFLRESVELVPGSETVSELSKNFLQK